MATLHMIGGIKAAGGDTGSVDVDDIDLSGAWEGFWGAFDDQLGTLAGLMTWAGAAILLFALIKYAWDRRRGSANSAGLISAILVGGILAGPNLILPVFLQLVDVVVNGAANLLNDGFDDAS